MNFRSFLEILRDLTVILSFDYSQREFDSRTVSKWTGIPVKKASNDLRRLYKMDLLNRRRAKRISISKRGKKCFKGFKYNYSISNQGFSYLLWMANPEEGKNYYRGVIDNTIKLKFSEPRRSKLLAIAKAVRSADQCPRFPGKKDVFDAIADYRLMRDGEIRNLSIENEALKSKNQQLSKENEQLRKIVREMQQEDMKPRHVGTTYQRASTFEIDRSDFCE